MRIGIPVATERVEVPNYYVNVAYVNLIAKAGFEPVLITPQNIPDCDGLLLPGGIDVDPIYYGYDNETSRNTDIEKDKFERNLLWKFIEMKKPIFGICRGFQFIFLEFCKKFPDNDKFLDYAQHIDGHNQNELKIVRNQPSHFVELSTGPFAVNSFHHQACLVLEKELTKSRQLTILGTTDRDTIKNYLIIECFKIPEWNVMAVQWHAEEMEGAEEFLKDHFNKEDE